MQDADSSRPLFRKPPRRSDCNLLILWVRNKSSQAFGKELFREQFSVAPSDLYPALDCATISSRWHQIPLPRSTRKIDGFVLNASMNPFFAQRSQKVASMPFAPTAAAKGEPSPSRRLQMPLNPHSNTIFIGLRQSLQPWSTR